MASGLNLWLAVASGGAIGACARYGVYRMFSAMNASGNTFPWATLTVNIIGSGVMGVLFVWLAKNMPQSEALRAFFMVGILGAFTTFSTFSMDAYLLYERKAYTLAGAYMMSSLVLSIVAFVLGLSIMKALS